uniref:AB hydrolase-1 domain-containing protein n=1 Tax=Clastoptera arizonana TaxID=38151 RepID=A0A1B6CI94_9HEMI
MASMKNVVTVASMQKFRPYITTTRALNTIKEIKIPVPWGHIAGKWWGRTDVQPILAVHGVQDTASTFDNLAPLLECEALLAIDLPGHGWSSHYPVGTQYSILSGVTRIRDIITSYYKWENPILLGHSLGSYLSFIYSASFPDEVHKYISIDCCRHFMNYDENKFLENLQQMVDKSLKYDHVDKNPLEYSYEELLDYIYIGRKKRLPKEYCEVLMRRGIKELPSKKFTFSRDSKVKQASFDYLSNEEMLQFSSNIKCEVLSIQADNGLTLHPKGEFYLKTVASIMKNNPNNQHIILKGCHHLHLTNPKDVADEINKFLN